MNGNRTEEGENGRRTEIPATDVRVGDTVVYTSRLNKEYRFTVAAVGPEWLTFETGQMVHTDRFDRDAFEVVRAGGGPPTANLPDAVGEEAPPREVVDPEAVGAETVDSEPTSAAASEAGAVSNTN